MKATVAEVVEFIHSSMTPRDRELVIKALNDQSKLANMRAIHRVPGDASAGLGEYR